MMSKSGCSTTKVVTRRDSARGLESFSLGTADWLLLWKLGVLKMCLDTLVDDHVLTSKLERCSTIVQFR
jgi:hypothetical protein